MRKYDININGIDVNATYNDKAIDEIFLPLLKKLTAMQKEKGRLILVFLAAPPGAGKSTLCSFLETLSKEYEDLCNEIINKMITNEKFYKYEIKQAIDDFLHKKVPNINDINLVYNPEIDIYYKYMENSFPEYILKEIRGIIKNEKISSSIDISNYNILLKKKEGAKNGSNRTNKK